MFKKDSIVSFILNGKKVKGQVIKTTLDGAIEVELMKKSLPYPAGSILSVSNDKIIKK